MPFPAFSNSCTKPVVGPPTALVSEAFLMEAKGLQHSFKVANVYVSCLGKIRSIAGETVCVNYHHFSSKHALCWSFRIWDMFSIMWNVIIKTFHKAKSLCAENELATYPGLRQVTSRWARIIPKEIQMFPRCRCYDICIVDICLDGLTACLSGGDFRLPLGCHLFPLWNLTPPPIHTLTRIVVET